MMKMTLAGFLNLSLAIRDGQASLASSFGASSYSTSV
jgi:hypothetical protein